MKKQHCFNLFTLIFLLLFSLKGFSQFPRYAQHNGNYTFTMLGNSFNDNENPAPAGSSCSDWLDFPNGHVSQDVLDLGNKPIIAAYAIWSSNRQDNNVTINGNSVLADNSYSYNFRGDFMWSQVANVTSIVQSIGDGTYSFTDLSLDRTSVDCGISYGGWSIIVIYEDASLPKNSVNIFLGLDGISSDNNNITIPINDLVIAEKEGATLGIIAWEGDVGISNGEQIRFDGNVLSNSINPANNAFNGTNSFNGNNELWNMDIDRYDISPYVIIGDDYDIEITASSLQDFVLFNCFAFTLNNVLPEPTVEITDIVQAGCGLEELNTKFVVKNENSNKPLPIGTEIKFYQDNRSSEPIFETVTTTEIPIGGQESFDVKLPITLSGTNSVKIIATVNLDKNGDRILLELNPNNNVFEIDVDLLDDYTTNEPAVEICEGGSFTLADGTVVTTADTYTTPIIDSNGCTNTVVQEVKVNPLPNSSNATLEECSDTTTGRFTLSDAITEIQNGDTTLTVTFYETKVEAEDIDVTTTLPDSYESETTTIFARVLTDKNCLVVQELELVVFAQPTLNNVSNIEECDDDNDGFLTFDLTTQINEIYGTQDTTLFDVKLFKDSGFTNEITDVTNYTNTSANETIYFTITNTTKTDCSTNGSFTITVNPLPNSADGVLDVCSLEDNGIFTLSDADTQIQNGDTDLTITYYETLAEAEDINNTNTLPNTYDTITTTIYARATTLEGCIKVQELKLNVFQQPVLNVVSDFALCDDDFDGTITFDLTTKVTEILGTQDSSLFDIKYFTDAGLSNEITNPSSYTNTNSNETIYFTITNKEKDDCTENGSFALVLNEKPEANNIPISRVNCSSNGFAIFNLNEVIDDVRNNDSSKNVEFYTDSALTDLITSPENFSSESATVYGKVINPTTGCFNTGEITLTVRENPEKVDITATAVCATNTGNNTAIFDLTPFTTQLVGTQQNVTITYHVANNDAETGTNPISNIDSFESTNNVIYARSEAVYNGVTCYTVSEITLPVNERPDAVKIDEYPVCSSSNVGRFELSTQIDTITNNESDRTVTFYDTEANAIAGGNTGLLSNSYDSSGETVYARVVNDLTGCVSTTSVTLKVVENPEITATFKAEKYLRGGIASFNLETLRAQLESDYPSMEFEFYPEGTDITDTTIAPLTGDYEITATENVILKYQLKDTDCYKQTTYELFVPEVPFIDYGDTVVCIGEEFTLPNNEVVNTTGEYIRTFIDEILDYDIRTRNNLIIGEIHFPNAFAPNGNGKNETFTGVPGAACVGEIENVTFEIYNRWGELVFSSNSLGNGWDGMFNGAPAQQGVYTWQATYTFKGEDVLKKGIVHLIR